ncbi:MAG TPA: hypothetical protein VGH28_20460 [Polyangiaceae bacterium]
MGLASKRQRRSASVTVAFVIGLGLSTSPDGIVAGLTGCGGGCKDDSDCGEGASCCNGSCSSLMDDENCGACGNNCNSSGSCLFHSTCTQQSYTSTASCSGRPGPPVTYYYYACSF